MDADDAIRTHVRWREKLAAYLNHPDGSISADELHAHGACTLGRWMHQEGTAFEALPEYAVLKSAHESFHCVAADTVRKADAGQTMNASRDLGLQSNFGAALLSLVNAIKMFTRKHRQSANGPPTP